MSSLINFCQISPVAHLDDFCAHNRVHLALAHLVEDDPVYTDWYANRNEPIILDNSAFEMYKQCRPMYSPSKLVEMGHKIGASYIVMSDYPGQHSSKTIEAAEVLAPEFIKEGFGTFFVPQSKKGDLQDYIEAFEWAAENPDLVEMIGVSILGAPNAFGDIEKDNKLQRFLSRWRIMGILKDRGILDKIRENGQRIHFLGALDGWPGEVELVREYWEYIYSWDSSQCVWHGLNGIEFDNSPTGLMNGKYENEVNFDFKSINPQDISKAHRNINRLITANQ